MFSNPKVSADGSQGLNGFNGYKRSTGFRISRDSGFPHVVWGFQRGWHFQSPKVSGFTGWTVVSKFSSSLSHVTGKLWKAGHAPEPSYPNLTSPTPQQPYTASSIKTSLDRLLIRPPLHQDDMSHHARPDLNLLTVHHTPPA